MVDVRRTIALTDTVLAVLSTAKKDAVASYASPPAVPLALQLNGIAEKGIGLHRNERRRKFVLVFSWKPCERLLCRLCDDDGPCPGEVLVRLRIRRAQSQPRLCGWRPTQPWSACRWVTARLLELK